MKKEELFNEAIKYKKENITFSPEQFSMALNLGVK